eukprot:6048052-Pyramimonas_sp.AAC.1
MAPGRADALRSWHAEVKRSQPPFQSMAGSEVKATNSFSFKVLPRSVCSALDRDPETSKTPPQFEGDLLGHQIVAKDILLAGMQEARSPPWQEDLPGARDDLLWGHTRQPRV